MYQLRDKDDDKITSELRDKLKSKMDVAKFYSGFVSIFLALSFKEMTTPLRSNIDLIWISAWIGILFILLSIAFAIITMFSLDRLLMSPELWKIPPTEKFNEKLKREMIRAWVRLFYLSILFFLIAILSFLIALTTHIVFPIIIFITILVTAHFIYRSLRIGLEIHG